jgi:hypothetical protein
VTVNVAEVDPAGMVSELTVRSSRALLLDSNTWTPSGGAAVVSVTVQVVAIPEVTLLGLQISWETGSGCPSAILENEKMATAATARLVDGFEFLQGPWLLESVPFSAEAPTDKLNASTCLKAEGADMTITAKTAARPLSSMPLFHRGAALGTKTKGSTWSLL